MNTPPFLIAAALLFWGWRTGWWAIAITLAVLFELSRFVKLRWEFTDKEYTRLFDVCTLLFGGSVVYLRFSEDISRSGFVLFQWSPVLFALMLLAQAYGARGQIPLRVFSWFMRLRKEKPENGEPGLNISWSYFALCLLAAGATNVRDPYFYLAALALCGWAAWATRVRRYSAPVWAACFLAAAAGGWVAQRGWTGLQSALLPLFGEVFARFGPKEFDALHARTSMGELGSRKTSGKIVLRVQAETGRVPSLLRQATFDSARDTTWSASRREFAKISPENDISTWLFQQATPPSHAVRISGFLPGRRGLLSLPNGATGLRELPVGKLERTALGVTRAEDGPGVVSYVADFSPDLSLDEAPSEIDTRVPDIEKPALAEIAAQLRAAAGSGEADLVRAVERHFAQNFTYSLYQKAPAVREGTVLSRFLRTTRSGHCEYFASATVLLLRQLGIPARYAVGFSVQEAKGDTWIIRERHGHAWALAWLDGAWREVDTTPGTWAQAEREQASRFEPIADFFSDLWFRFSLWRWLGQKGVISQVAPFLVLPLVAILVWRIFVRKKRVDARRAAPAKFNWPGLDSEYYTLEARLAVSGHERHPHETPQQWLARLRRDGADPDGLSTLVDLHYRYRFDPRGLPDLDRRRLRELARPQKPT